MSLECQWLHQKHDQDACFTYLPDVVRQVHSHPPPVTSVDKLRLARRQAALLALDGKMRRAVSAT